MSTTGIIILLAVTFWVAVIVVAWGNRDLQETNSVATSVENIEVTEELPQFPKDVTKLKPRIRSDGFIEILGAEYVKSSTKGSPVLLRVHVKDLWSGTCEWIRFHTPYYVQGVLSVVNKTSGVELYMPPTKEWVHTWD